MGKRKKSAPADAATLDKAVVNIMRAHSVLPLSFGDLALVLVHRRVNFTSGRLEASLKRLREQGLLKKSPTKPGLWLFIVPAGLKKRFAPPLVQS